MLSKTLFILLGLIAAAVPVAAALGWLGLSMQYLESPMPLHRAIFTGPGLVGAKYAMSRLDLCSDEVRRPLSSLLDTTKALIDDGLRHAGLLN